MWAERVPRAFGDLMAQPTRNGIHKGPDFQGRGAPVVKMGEVYDTDHITDRSRDLLELREAELDRLQLHENDLLFCRTSLVRAGVGRCALVGRLSQRTVFASNLIRVRLDPEVARPRFWFYFFRSSVGRELLQTIARGTSVTTITGPDLAGLPVSVPPLEEQDAITDTLGALDDKIELNRRMSETLEQIARALYMDWFGGVGLKGSVASMGSVSDLVEFDPRMSVQRGQPVPYLGLAELPTSGPVHVRPRLREFTSGAKFRNFDTLLARITPSLENGKTAIANGLLGDGIAWGSTEIIVMRARSHVPFALPYLIARDDGFRALAIQNMSGTSGRQRVPRKPLEDAPIVTPSTDRLDRFGSIADSLFTQIFTLARQNETLDDLRDTLLPKLISGELRLPEAERVVSEVA